MKVYPSSQPPGLPKTNSLSYVAGDDGALQIGVDVTPRFQLNADGTVTDFVTQLVLPRDPTTMDIVNLTGVAVPRGAWAADYPGGTSAGYAKGDMVSIGGVAYISKSDANINHQPPNATYWGVTTWAADAATPPLYVLGTQAAMIAKCRALVWNGFGPNVWFLMNTIQSWSTFYDASFTAAGGPNVNTGIFTNFPAGNTYYWTSSPYVKLSGAWGMYFNSAGPNMTPLAWGSNAAAFPARKLVP